MKWFDAWEETGRISEGIVAGVREGDIANAKLMILSKDGNGVAQLVATTNADKIQHLENDVGGTYPSTPSMLAILPSTIARLMS